MLSSTTWGLLLLVGLSCLAQSSLAEGVQGAEMQDTHPPSELPASPLKITSSLADFSFSLYRRMAQKSNSSNIFFSPVSITSVFAMLSLGARGETHHQILEGMHFNLSQRADADIHHGFQHLLRSLNQPDSQLQLNMGSSLFIQEGFKVAEKFLEDAKTLYHSEAFSTNFQKTEEAKKQINDYVEKKTQGHIVDLVQELDANTVLALVNYIFFKGKWEKPFSEKWTSEQDFHVDEKTTIKVPMMFQKGDFTYEYSDSLSSWLLLLHYEGNATAMFLLPDEGKMRHLEDTLSPELLSNFLDNRHTRTAVVYLPKMSISGSSDLIPILRSLGISRVFTAGAQLSGISEDASLMVSKAVHKAVLTVDEEGTRAAGATSVGVTFYSGPPIIRFNKPFLIMIFDNISKVPLFVGKVMNPKQV